MLKQNPCRYCALSLEYKGKHYSSLNPKCRDCTNLRQHKNYLHTQRKFIDGEPITSIEELLKQEWVMWYHNTKHIEVFKSMPLRGVLKFLERGAFHKAIRKVVEPVKAESEE